MIALVGSGSELRAALLDALRDFDVRTVETVDHVPAQRGIRAAVLCLPELTIEEGERLALLHSRLPLLPIFLVTKLNPAAVEQWYKLSTHATVVWADQIDSLALILAAHVQRGPRMILYEALRKRPGLSKLILDALELCWCSVQPPTSQQGFSKRLHTSPWTLRRHWKRELSRIADANEAMEWRTLLDLAELPPNTTIDDAAFLLGRSPRTLERIARRWLKCTPTRARLDKARLHAEFAKWARAAYWSSA